MKIIDILKSDKIDIAELKKKWNKTWYISKWGDEYELIKLRNMSYLHCWIKPLEKNEAENIIKALALVASKVAFKFLYSYRTKEEWARLKEEWAKN